MKTSQKCTSACSGTEEVKRNNKNAFYIEAEQKQKQIWRPKPASNNVYEIEQRGSFYKQMRTYTNT